MQLPQNPYILLSYINTKLRDQYQSLEALCKGLELDQGQLEATLASIDYAYVKGTNQFTAV